MKRIIALMICFTLVLVGCDKDDITETTDVSAAETEAQTTAEETEITVTTVETTSLNSESDILVLPSIEHAGDITLPLGEPLVEARAIMGNPTFLVYDKGLTYYVKQYTSPLNGEYILKKYTLSLPDGYTDGVIISDGPGGGSGELGFMVHAKKGNTDVVLGYLFYADRLAAPVEVWEETDVAFTPDNGIIS